MHPLLIGVGVSTAASADADPVVQAQRAEALGIDFVSMSDHPSGSHPTYEAWTLLSWIAASTSTISVASRVLSLPFRAPALVAKMAESLDRLSTGRLILGLGGGAADDELRGFGLPVPSAREKVDGMTDAMRIMRGLWTDPEFTYAGAVHHTDAAVMAPKANRAIPIWLGTYGDRALAATGRYADGWIPSLGYVSRDELIVMRSKVIASAQEAGREAGDIRCVLNVQIDITDNVHEASDALTGTAEEVTDQLRDFIDDGFRGLNIIPAGDDEADQIERFAADVMPGLRKS